MYPNIYYISGKCRHRAVSGMETLGQTGSRRILWIAAIAIVGLAAIVLLAEPGSAQASQLKFRTEPRNEGAGLPFDPVVTVGVYSSTNTLVTTGTHTVTLTLQTPQAPALCPGTYGGSTKPCGRLLQASSGTLSTITGTTAGGIVSFPGLRVDAMGKGYTIVATAPG